MRYYKTSTIFGFSATFYRRDQLKLWPMNRHVSGLGAHSRTGLMSNKKTWICSAGEFLSLHTFAIFNTDSQLRRLRRSSEFLFFLMSPRIAARALKGRLDKMTIRLQKGGNLFKLQTWKSGSRRPRPGCAQDLPTVCPKHTKTTSRLQAVPQLVDIYSHVLDKTMCCPSIPKCLRRALVLKYKIRDHAKWTIWTE